VIAPLFQGRVSKPTREMLGLFMRACRGAQPPEGRNVPATTYHFDFAQLLTWAIWFLLYCLLSYTVILSGQGVHLARYTDRLCTDTPAMKHALRPLPQARINPRDKRTVPLSRNK